MKPAVRLIAYVDEAGCFGLVRDIDPSRDELIGILAAIIFTPEKHREATEALAPYFLAFKEAAPPGAKLHITDAFAPGNEDWAAVATEVRDAYLSTLARLRCPITYAARRHGIARFLRDYLDESIEAYPAPPSPIRIVGGERPNPERIEDTIMKYLALRLDAYAEDCDPRPIDLVFDATDSGVMRRYKAAIERTKSISGTTTVTHGWNQDARKQVTATMRTSVSSAFPVDVQFLGELHVSSKDDPIVLAADIVANSINYHLKKLPPDAPLHRLESLASWHLNSLVWGNRNNPIEDIL